ncbi:MAG TPA: serine/threonine-protein kinase, partial [Verrucomicrobiales bacterium]|nr:serine/threonine-protein kinase [Verrucomicrobiales bacterium]
MLQSPEDPAPAAEPVIGRFGEYELMSVAGRGGMGVVYRARHLRLGREIALKMVAFPVLAGESAARRFRAEVESMAGLDHPHIIPVYEFGEVEGQAYYTMKIIDGGHLSARLRDTAWPVAERVRLLVKVTRAVDYAHRHGVLHRDLKPSNIMIDAAGEPHVCDFGLARRLEGESSITLSGTALGTPEYMAPEQASGDTGRATTAADVYSLGAILYECLAGRPPFHGGNALETMRQVLEQEPAAPSPVSHPADRDLETIAMKCLSKEPARRYLSAAALADDLERWQRHEPITARRPGPLERAGKWLRRHPALTAIAGLLVAAGGTFLWQHLREEERVKSERDRAEAGWAASRARLYAADMDAVADALDRGDHGVAVARLQAHLPSSGAPDERGLEWY